MVSFFYSSLILIVLTAGGILSQRSLASEATRPPLTFSSPNQAQWIRWIPYSLFEVKVRTTTRGKIKRHCPTCFTLDGRYYYSDLRAFRRAVRQSCSSTGTAENPNPEVVFPQALCKEGRDLAFRTLKPVLTRRELRAIFAIIAAMDHIPFKYSEDGCFARAHEMARLLEDYGYFNRKLFITGRGNMRYQNGTIHIEEESLFRPTLSDQTRAHWAYHVASLVYVIGENDHIEPWVIDPSVYSRPVPQNTWVEHLAPGRQCEQVARDIPWDRQIEDCAIRVRPRWDYMIDWPRSYWNAGDFYLALSTRIYYINKLEEESSRRKKAPPSDKPNP